VYKPSVFSLLCCCTLLIVKITSINENCRLIVKNADVNVSESNLAVS